ncbi:MAG TPA: hypothetical protein VEB43_01015 [Anaeromyxobacter sp.]|nr:hypothetical protein [Anaeromyxobacter sp.]
MRAPLAAAAIAAALSLALPAAAAPSERAARPARAVRAAPDPFSRLLARTFRLYGGVDALLGVRGIRLRGVVDDGTTAPGSRPQLERLLEPPDRFQATVSLGGLERESLTLAGGRAFRDGAEVTGLLRADQIRLEAARVFLPGALARARAALVDRGEAVRGGQRARRVELRLHRDAVLTAELDAASGRILRSSTRVGRHETAVIYGRLQPIAGVLFPFEEAHESREGRRRVLVTAVELVPAGAVRIEPP